MTKLEARAVNKNLTGILAAEVQRCYPFSVLEAKPAGAVWKVYTSSGLYALKRTQKNTAELKELVTIIDLCRSAGFPNLVSIIPTKPGELSITVMDRNYILSPWLDGQNPDFSNRRHLQMVASLWGKLHRISQTVITSKVMAPEPILDELQSKICFLKNLTDLLAKTKQLNRIDRAIQKWIFHFINLADFCIQKITAIAGAPRIEPVLTRGFCHNDPAPRNIIMQNRNLFLIDLELASSGPCIKELAKLIARTLQINHWDSSLFNFLINAYSAEKSLTEYETMIFPYLCAFPNGFWRLCSQRFQEQLPWTEKRFQKRLWEITTMEHQRLKCLHSLIPELPGD